MLQNHKTRLKSFQSCLLWMKSFASLDALDINFQGPYLFTELTRYACPVVQTSSANTNFSCQGRRPSLYYVSKRTGWVWLENGHFCWRLVLYLCWQRGWVRKSPKLCWRNKKMDQEEGKCISIYHRKPIKMILAIQLTRWFIFNVFILYTIFIFMAVHWLLTL